MEYALLAAVVGYGYYYHQTSQNVPLINKEEPKNIFESKRALKIRQDELKYGDQVYKEPNRIFAGPPKHDNKPVLFNKVDYQNNKLPIEFNSFDKNDIYSEIKVTDQPNKPINQYDSNFPIAGGWYGVSLNGEPIDPNTFKHNNMVPFFGSTVKQNLDEKANATKLETFTGNINYYEEKKEIGPLFQPETNVSNPYGMASFTSYEQNRYIPSKIMNNVTPVERVRVGPGLNQGYTAQPSGGFQQINARDYQLPKNVDELRVKTNPKLTYHGRILAGVHIGKPGKIGLVQKNRPDNFFINTPDRWFTTTGAHTAERMRPNIVLKDSNRKTTVLKRRLGPAGPAAAGFKERIRSKVRKSDKCQFRGFDIKPADMTGRWTIPGQENNLHDYGKHSINIKDNSRVKTGKCNYIAPVSVSEGKGRHAVRNNQKAKKTRKQGLECNPRPEGYIKGDRMSGHVKDPMDIARTTIKETQIDNKHEGYMQPQKPSNTPAYDPNDVMRTTIKETQIDNTHEGHFKPVKPEHVPVYDPNDVMRTTIKETQIDNTRDGDINPQMPAAPPVKDPSDVPRTTIKETHIDDNHVGVAGNNDMHRAPVYDPDDVLKTTTKETTLSEQPYGSAQGKECGGYQVTEVTAPNTMRQFTTTEYTGGAAPSEHGEGGYKVADVKARNTMRQFTSDYEYSGPAGSTVSKKPGSYEYLYNSTIRSLRQDISQGRAPSRIGPVNHQTEVNMTTKRVGDIQNSYINERGLAPTRVYNSLPQKQACSWTKDRNKLPNEPLQDRLDASLLDAFRNNPYTQSLASYVFP